MLASQCTSAVKVNWIIFHMCHPGALHQSVLINIYSNKHADVKIASAAIPYIKEEQPDFLFLYLGETDEKGGHDLGWILMNV